MTSPNPTAARSAPLPQASIRCAVAADLDALVALEERCFTYDRMTRRSFQRLLKTPSARVLVAEAAGALVGDAVLTWRRGVAVARLYSLAVDPAARGSGVAAALLDAAEATAEAQGAALLRLEVTEENAAARRLYARSGYRQIGRAERYYDDGAAALRLEKTLRRAPAPQRQPRYYAQTTEFTCGPACLMMARAWFDPLFAPSPLEEIRLWRQTTTVFMTSGHGGCDPFGMAVALDEIGVAAEVHVSEAGPLFLKTVAREDKRRVMRLAQEDFRAEAAARGLPCYQDPPMAEALAERLKDGALAIVLISGNRMLAERIPHWVLAHAADDRHIFLHDPWQNRERDESEIDAVGLPVPYAEFDRMARWGGSKLRAMVIASGPKPTLNREEPARA